MLQATLTQPVLDTAKRSSKRDAVLDVGARLMNDQGVGGVKLGDIAELLGLSRSALYYYVTDRTDLVQQCYLKSCDVIEGDLKAVTASKSTPRKKILAFIRSTLSPDRPQRAVLADIDALDEPYRLQVQARYDQHVKDLGDILRAGQADGSFKQFDTEIASNALLGMLNWTLLWVNWLTDKDAASRTKLNASVIAIQNLFLEGLGGTTAGGFASNLDYSALTRQKYNVFDKADANRLRRLQLVEAASLLFNRRGLEGTTIDEIGEAVGASKGAVYHHFRDKAELIEYCYDRAYEHYETIIRATEESYDNSLDIVLSVFHLNCQAQASVTPPLILQPGLSRLPSHFLDRSNAIVKKLRCHLDAAEEDGGIHEFSPEILDVSAGAFFWIQKWRSKDTELSSMQIANQLTALIKSGVCTDTGAALSD